jgi:hypothetical protein
MKGKPGRTQETDNAERKGKTKLDQNLIRNETGQKGRTIALA